jgi:GxxExxY protein
MSKLVLEKETYDILGACFEVYKEKGCGFLEGVYQECLEIEFELRGIPTRSLVSLPLTYKGRKLRKTYKADFICFGKVLIELKAVSKLTDEHRVQVQNYLHATALKVGTFRKSSMSVLCSDFSVSSVSSVCSVGRP